MSYSPEYMHKYYLARKEKSLEAGRKWRLSHVKEAKEYNKKYAKEHFERGRELKQRRNDKLKLEVLSYYSNVDFPKCVICGIEDIDILTIDHINGDGAEHRRSIGGNRIANCGISFYHWLRKNKFPTGFQTLCFNCNYKKEIVKRREGRKPIGNDS